jgi:hypothetical protein
MSIPVTKACYNIDRDDLSHEIQAKDDSEDGRVINLFSRHNTLEEYMQILNSSKK